MSDIRLRMPREKWEAIQQAKRDVEAAQRALNAARDRLRGAWRDAEDSTLIRVQ